MLSVLDLFRIGIGPSSSHTVGPMRIAGLFLADLAERDLLHAVVRMEVELRGSLALTGVGHAAPEAVMLGLMGFAPETIDPDSGAAALRTLHAAKRLELPTGAAIHFDPAKDIGFAHDAIADPHPNGLVCRAYDDDARCLLECTYYSIGGGFVATAAQLAQPDASGVPGPGVAAPFPFGSAQALLDLCLANGTSIADVVLTSEDALRPRAETDAGLDRIASAMDGCISSGLAAAGELPGGLRVIRRAPQLWQRLKDGRQTNESERLFDWLNCFAMAVSEENAAGGRVVTAPTNGAAGIIPAVMKFYLSDDDPARRRAQRRAFLLVSGAIGLLFKQRASISGAEMGCQGEVGVACAMAAAGLAAHWGATPLQITSAAEIGIEHNLGLTCDPVGGLVQVPCIERNAIGAVKAVNAARLALHRDGPTRVSLDQAIETMRQTGCDMSRKYKETSLGGLAVNVVEC